MLNYYQLLATGNWKLSTVLSPSIRDTQYAIRSTKDYVRNYKLFMQNKANFRKSQMNVNNVLTKDYDKKDTWLSGKTKPIQSQLKPIQSQSNPIKANKMPKQTQYEPKSKPIYRGVASGEAGTKSQTRPWRANFRANICCCV